MWLLSKFWGYIVTAGALILSILGIFFAGQRSAINKIKAKEAEANLKIRKKADAIRDTVNTSSESTVNKRLSKYQRKK